MKQLKLAYYSDLDSGSGVGNYEYELYNHLSKYKELIVDPIPLPACEVPVIGKYVSFIYKFRKNIRRIAEEYDIIHLPAQFQAAGLINNKIDAKIVVTVHDIIPYVKPEFTNILSQKFASLVITGLAEADYIISISNHTKSDIIRNTNISEQNISVIYPSVSRSWLNDPAPEEELEAYDISNPYILYVGTQGKKKNIETVIDSLEYCQNRVDLQFVIAGSPGNPLQLLKSKYMCEKKGVEDQVIRTGFVDQSVLARLYHSASIFVFPTKYEGYGRPPLESMCAGTPVIASNTTAVPEILGNAAVLLDPDNAEEWGKSIIELLENKSLREELIKKGYNQVDKYTWEECASKTLEIYKK